MEKKTKLFLIAGTMQPEKIKKKIDSNPINLIRETSNSRIRQKGISELPLKFHSLIYFTLQESERKTGRDG